MKLIRLDDGEQIGTVSKKGVFKLRKSATDGERGLFARIMNEPHVTRVGEPMDIGGKTRSVTRELALAPGEENWLETVLEDLPWAGYEAV